MLLRFWVHNLENQHSFRTRLLHFADVFNLIALQRRPKTGYCRSANWLDFPESDNISSGLLGKSPVLLLPSSCNHFISSFIPVFSLYSHWIWKMVWYTKLFHDILIWFVALQLRTVSEELVLMERKDSGVAVLGDPAMS